jgi:hypothetical protein
MLESTLSVKGESGKIVREETKECSLEMNIYKKVCGSDGDEKFMNLLLLVSRVVSSSFWSVARRKRQSTFHTVFFR